MTINYWFLWLIGTAGVLGSNRTTAVRLPQPIRAEARPAGPRVHGTEPDFVRRVTQLEPSQGETPRGRLDCDPCIDRPTFNIKAITHGTRDGGLFWHQVRSAAHSAARLLRIQLDFELYDDYSPVQMAKDIEAAVNADVKPDALLVTVPSPLVHDSIRMALSKGVPVFGINSGRDVMQELGLLGFLGMDERLGGVKAAEEFMALTMSQTQNNSTKRALFVNHAKGVTSLADRFQGLYETLTAGNSSSFNDSAANFLVDQFFFNQSHLNSNISYNQQLEEFATSYFKGCPYNAILLAGASTLEFVTSALYSQGCFISKEKGGTLLGTFDASVQVYDAIAVGKLHFAVSQQQHLQGMQGVLFATLFATVEKRLVYTDGNKAPIFSTGPKIVTLENLPPDTMQLCETDAFPVCPFQLDAYGVEKSKCPCTDMTKITIAGVFHGSETSKFWFDLVAQSYEAATDLDVDFQLYLQQPIDDENIINSKMANKIVSLCQEGVHGIVVSIPNEAVVPAIKQCMELKVPIMSINSGAEIGAEIGTMHHIGQTEYNAGYEAGERMIDLGMKQAMCPHEVGTVGLIMRCSGFRDAVIKAQNTTSNVEWLSMPVLRVYGYDYASLYLQTVEEEVARLNANWDGLGILLSNSAFVPYSLQLKEKHPNILIGTFDKEDFVYESIASGDVLFGIDQGDYLQGYLPIWLLTINAYTQQFLQNQYLASGPAFIDKAPPANAIQCEADQFKVCPPPVNHNYNQLTQVRPVGLALCTIVFLAALFCAGWTILYRHDAVVAIAQPFFLVMLALGTIVMSSAIIPMSFDDSIASLDGCSMACMAFPWLFTTGFTLVFGALKIKLNRVNRLMAGARRFRRIEVTIWQAVLPLVALLIINVSLMLAWTLVDPMYFTRVDDGEDKLSSYGMCILGHTTASSYLFGAVASVNICALIMAVVEAYRARDINDSLSESTYIFWILAGMLQTSVVGVPLIALVSTIPVASYFVKAALIFVNCMSTLALIFVPKINKWNTGWSPRHLSVYRETANTGTSHHFNNLGNRSELVEGFTGAMADSKSIGSERFTAAVADNRSVMSHGDEDTIKDLVNKVLKLEELMNQRGINAGDLFEEAELNHLLKNYKSQLTESAQMEDEKAANESFTEEKPVPVLSESDVESLVQVATSTSSEQEEGRQ